MNAVDTNILVYSFDQDEPAKRAKALALIQLEGTQQSAVLLWQTAVEVLACLRRFEQRGKISRDESDAYWTDLRNLLPLVLPTPAVIDRAHDIFRRRSISHWDSLLVAACWTPASTSCTPKTCSLGRSKDR